MRRLAFLLIVITCLSGCDSLTGSSNIMYEITGNAASRVSVTYESDSGQSQVSSAAVPWSYSFKAKKGDFLYVSAQIVQGAGPITVRIFKGSEIFKSGTASGFAAIATATGTLD
jgi:hypothetical protein